MRVRRATILLAEDDPDDVFLMERAFAKAPLAHSLQVVRNGEEAISYLSGQSIYFDRERFPMPALLLLDLKLPRKSGHEVLAWLRQQNNALKRLPVLVLSSSADSRDVNRAYDLGANSYLVKPGTFEDTVQLLRSLESFWFMLSEYPEIHP